MQKQVILQPTVLGEMNENTQIKFYEENNVLGIREDKEIQEEKKFNLFGVVLTGLERLDKFILNQYLFRFKKEY